MCSYTNDDLAKLILRCAIGFLMIFHGVAKLQHGVDPMMGMLEGKGLPSFIAYGVYIGEVIAPIMLIIGYKVRLAAIIIIATMITAIWLVFADKIFTLTKMGGLTTELSMFYILTSLAVFFLGAGKYSIDKK